MKSIDADRRSTASASPSLSAGISSPPVVNFATGSAVARDPFPRSREVDAADLPFVRPLAWSGPLAPVARAPATVAVPKPQVIPKERPEHLRRDYIIQRALEIMPGAVALLIITSFIWGSIFFPLPFALALSAFYIYWIWRSFNTAIHVTRGRSILKKNAEVDWRQRYNEAAAKGKAFLRWEEVRHVVIIPSYKETVEKLSTTLETLANQSLSADKLVVVLALEGAEAEAPAKAAALREKYGDRFMLFFPTFHPPNIPGEIKGKSSNENWAARIAKRRLVDEIGYDLDLLTVTSCDADTQFPPGYYACLTYKFATNAKRYRRFWQAPIFYYNNVWEVPAPLRLPNSLGGLNHLAKLTRKYCVLFPQSTYSLSLRMAHEVDYWDPDIISEDWHMFLKCFFHCGGTVDVEPIFLPVGNDGVRVSSYFRTFWEHYQQARRHAWGACDIPYAIKKCLAHPEIRLRTRLRRTWGIIENHVLWSSQWFLISVPAGLYLLSQFHLGPNIVFGPQIDVGSLSFPAWSGAMLKPCLAPLIVMIICDMAMRPSRPKGFSRWLYPVQFAQWAMMAVITFLFNALPALDSQMRLLIGKRLEYKVTEKA
ncbi:MAG TPA: glycosyltransferase family 2 protein [Dehalococcoidia bacterium]|nr:glycosyltransferase family 2 protein [Dehalococcoidia bacterium]